MFSKYFSSLKIEDLLSTNIADNSEVSEILSGNSLSLLDVAKLITAYHNPFARKSVIEKAVKVRSSIWHNSLFIMPPLYISNGDKKRGGCLDHCLYCPWHNGNVPQEQIIRLSAGAVRDEVKLLLDMGYGDIELVSATDPVLFSGMRAVNYVAAAKNAGAKNVGINFFPFKSAADYSELASAGCTFSIVWQETYLANIYRKMHPCGPKLNMGYRLDAHDRALRGGIKTVGVAFLGGLADWRYETLATIAHARYLRKEYGANIIFGMPRWKNGVGVNITSCTYDDQMYEFVGALYSLAVPQSLPWFSTRENFNLSDRSARGGGCIFTLDCSTEVGGYSHKNGAPQFPVFSTSFKQGAELLKKSGFKINIHLPFGE
ncbi:MAG: hypothetical protein UT48_C0001G0062 [Parcubacteria group bacterium GW2011_GWE2_39_37]|uniref:Biotin synthase n=1 Tax=Candidatus Falkowbacteria bacterium GW2011_GWF2_39_8 TaxID=1618642 RepID=A0A0G0T7G8_9BACT|nr:MAG: hypothetical protein UT48_C0001G0062 [Parcubacteria group bacterium GW2011_GWE2_39_37]KKR33787.1 MAG: hypothetical protein UT64_C0003G0008 [Candidatus Falkowbacteria bacterium GW2011_GWF2_39_8]